jgi:hypothetical protein
MSLGEELQRSSGQKLKDAKNSLFFFGGWKKSCTTSISLHLLMHSLYPRTPKLNVERHVNRWCRISVTRTNPF